MKKWLTEEATVDFEELATGDLYPVKTKSIACIHKIVGYFNRSGEFIFVDGLLLPPPV